MNERQDSPPFNLAEYQLLDVIDNGGDCIVSRVLVGGFMACMKKIVIGPYRSRSLQRMRSECRIYNNIPRHPNIVQFLGCYEDESKFCVFMTPYDVSLHDMLNSKRATGPMARYIIAEVCKGLKHLHEHDIAHLDVKPDNIFLFENMRGAVISVTLGDLDNSHPVRKIKQGKVVGTTGYTAPEILNGDPYSQRADIFSLGMTIYQIITGKFPYGEKRNDHEVTEAIIEGSIPKIDDSYSEEFRDLINIYYRAVQLAPNERIGLDEIIDRLGALPQF